MWNKKRSSSHKCDWFYTEQMQSLVEDALDAFQEVNFGMQSRKQVRSRLSQQFHATVVNWKRVGDISEVTMEQVDVNVAICDFTNRSVDDRRKR